MLRVTGLGKGEYEVVGRSEMEAQIKWRRQGDWRAGSVPVGWGKGERKREEFG